MTLYAKLEGPDMPRGWPWDASVESQGPLAAIARAARLAASSPWICRGASFLDLTPTSPSKGTLRLATPETLWETEVMTDPAEAQAALDQAPRTPFGIAEAPSKDRPAYVRDLVYADTRASALWLLCRKGACRAQPLMERAVAWELKSEDGPKAPPDTSGLAWASPREREDASATLTATRRLLPAHPMASWASTEGALALLASQPLTARSLLVADAKKKGQNLEVKAGSWMRRAISALAQRGLLAGEEELAWICSVIDLSGRAEKTLVGATKVPQRT